MPSRGDIVNEARSCIGTPFHHQGRLKGVGLDCVGLLTVIGKKFEIPFEDLTDYPIIPPPGLLEQFLKKACSITTEEPREGDIITLVLPRPGYVCHVGIYTICGKGPGIIHTYPGLGKVVEHNINKQWSRRIRGVWRIPGVT